MKQAGDDTIVIIYGIPIRVHDVNWGWFSLEGQLNSSNLYLFIDGMIREGGY